MTLQQLTTFVTRTIGGLPEDKRAAVRLLFINPTDAAVAVFEMFAEWQGIETLAGIVETAKELNITHAEFVEEAFGKWMHTDEDNERCPGCGCGPGDGRTAGCTHPDGCGYWDALHAANTADGAFDGTEDLNDARSAKPFLFNE